MNMSTIEEDILCVLEKLLAKSINIEDCKTNLRINALFETFMQVCMFSKEYDLDEEKRNILLRLQSELIQQCQKGADFADILSWFKENLTKKISTEFRSSVEKEKIFARDIADFYLKSFFQHYHLYQYILHHQKIPIIINQEVKLDVISSPLQFLAPLEESFEKTTLECYMCGDKDK